MIEWFLGLALLGKVGVVLTVLVLALVVAIYVDVYVVRASDVTLPAHGLVWVDDGKVLTLPPTPTGRDVHVAFGHWLFWLPFMRTYFGWNDRVVCESGHRPNAATFAHEVYHACFESVRHGLAYLPWYLVHGSTSEAEAHAHMRKHYRERWYQMAADYLVWNRTTLGVGKPLPPKGAP